MYKMLGRIAAQRATQLAGVPARAAYIAYRMQQEGLSLGDRGKAIKHGLEHGFPGTKGDWTNAPGVRRRIGNLTGSGAIFWFLSQIEAQTAFESFNLPDFKRNFNYTSLPFYLRFGHSPVVEDLETRMVGMVGGDFNKIEAVALSAGQAANYMAICLFAYIGVSREMNARLIQKGVRLSRAELHRGNNGIIIPSRGLYGCTYDELVDFAEYQGLDVHSIDCTDLDGSRSYLDELEETLRNNPHIKTVFLEGLNNPNITLIDLKNAARVRNRINKERGVENDVKLVVDLTFTTPQIRPFEWEEELWPDLVTYSLTKLGAGGSNVSGCIVGKREYISGGRSALSVMKNTGPIIADSVAEDLLLSGLPTLPERALLGQHSASLFAREFEGDSRVEIIYPGLPSHPQYDLARELMVGYDGEFAPSHMIRIRLLPPPGGDRYLEGIVRRVIGELGEQTSLTPLERFFRQGINYAVSLGNDAHLATQPVSTTQIIMEIGDSKVLPDQLLCTFADLRASIGLSPVHIAIKHLRAALHKGYWRYRT